RALLRSGGSYVVRTPHRSFGPADLGLVLDLEQLAFMHLHEFSFQEFEYIKDVAGYSAARAIFNIPKTGIARASSSFFSLMTLVDELEAKVTNPGHVRRALRRMARFALVPSNIWVELVK